MTEAASTKTNPWPFLAISLLVLLLAAFLYLRLGKRNLVSPQPAQPVDDAFAAHRTDPLEAEWSQRVEKARALLKEGKLEEAAAVVEEARKIRDHIDLADLTTSIESARTQLARQEEAQFALELDQLRQKWEEGWEKNCRWDEARKAVEEFAKKFSRVATDEDFKGLRKRIEGERAKHEEAYEMSLEEAKSLQREGKTSSALHALERALSFFPERAKDVEAIRGEWARAVHEKEMVRINDAEVWIGDDGVEDEKPKRKFKGAAFRIDPHEVTNEEYALFLAATGHPAPRHWRDGRFPPGRENHPVTHVSLLDAEAYAKWAKKRLPTAEEWEKAARFIDGRKFPWGDEFPPPGSSEFFANSFEYWQERKTQNPAPLPVGSFPNGKSGFEVYDMAGNVWEWTSTRVTVERDGKPVEMAVLKGGSYMTTQDALRCSNRLLDEVDLAHPDYGFRCVRD